MADFTVGGRVVRTKEWRYAQVGELGTVVGVNDSGSLRIDMDNGHCTPNGSSQRFVQVVGSVSDDERKAIDALRTLFAS